MSTDTEKIAIIGAGASGLAAAIAQSRLGRKVTVFEHKDRAGKKLLITGNGKCNFTNACMDASCFHRAGDAGFCGLLDRFTAKDALDFIRSLCVDITSKEGYYYPADMKAETIVKALLDECDRQGVNICYGVTDIDVDKLRKSYSKIIFACGSRAHKETGSNGTGYKLLEHLGIPYTRVLPALCALYCDDDGFLEANKGKRAIATVSFQAEASAAGLTEQTGKMGHAGQPGGTGQMGLTGRPELTATGELQITDYGISGIPVFNISRYISILLDKGQDASVTVDFEPDTADIPAIIKNRSNMNNYRPIVGDRIKTFRITKTAGFDKSQVCTGGVSLDDLTDDFEVKKVPGIYVIGEMCDVDGICGGYNLHWAWLSANLCAK